MYFDDLPEGFTFETETRSLPLDEILEFANKWDRQPFHTDAEAARGSAFGQLIASGFHTILVAFMLTLDRGILEGGSMGSPGMDKIRWLGPVLPGDSIMARGEVLSSTLSASRPDRGRTVIRYRVFNQRDEEVASYEITHILRRQAGAASG